MPIHYIILYYIYTKMEFSTPVTLSKPLFTLSYTDEALLLGSCFAENIGQKLKDNKFHIDVNPFGTLYNPLSIAESIHKLLDPLDFKAEDLFQHENSYHSFSHHSRFSSSSEEDCLNKINARLFQSSQTLTKASRLIVTFGTAYTYILRSSGQIVSNCHKLPEKLFHRKLLTVNEIVAEWKIVLSSLIEWVPGIKILFTVSPIRHWKDGAHANQISKSTLLLAINELQKEYPNQVDYFPAYEIMMDELRDYRFYADDMIHPSALAINYIWERFIENRVSKDSKEILKEWTQVKKAIDHKPFQPESTTYQEFVRQTLLKIEQIQKKMPSFDLSLEKEVLQSKRCL